MYAAQCTPDVAAGNAITKSIIDTEVRLWMLTVMYRSVPMAPVNTLARSYGTSSASHREDEYDPNDGDSDGVASTAMLSPSSYASGSSD